MSHDKAWHEARRQGIGGSDATIIMGGDDQAIYNLWLEKRGEREPEDLSWVLPVQIGIVTEMLNILWLEHVSGLDIIADCQAVQSSEYPFMRCIPDGLTPDTLVECKHVNAFSDMDEVVKKYTSQLTHNMIVTKRRRGILSVFKGTTDHHWFEVQLDDFYAADLIERERAFWACVQDGTPPVSMPEIAAPVPPDKWRTVSFEGNNHWSIVASDWLENRSGAKLFEASAKEIKRLIEPDVGEASGHGILVKRSKAGALTIKEV